jgi:hypothetical protein
LIKLLTGFVVGGVLGAGLVLGGFIGFGFVGGRDIQSGLRAFYTRPAGVTVDPDSVSSRNVGRVEWLGNLENYRLNEASGLARSTLERGVFFALNDSGNPPEIFAHNEAGDDLGVWAVEGADNDDWEALASYRQDGASYLVIGDTGDNFRWRQQLYLHIIAEPDVQASALDVRLPVLRTIRFTYPGGEKRDCEAIAVDGGFVYLVSKRVVPAEVFRVPLDATEPVVAEHVADLATLPQPEDIDLLEDPEFGDFRSTPTGLTFAGRRAVVVTYKHAYLYERRVGGNWAAAFTRMPERIVLPPGRQRESVELSADGKRLFVSEERYRGRGAAPIFRVRL